MSLRIVKVDEYQFLKCFEFGVWGSNRSTFSNWNPGDLIAFTINKKLTALAEVKGGFYKSDEFIWDNGLFPNRINLAFKVVLLPEDRIDVTGKVRETLIKSWGANYGWGILNQTPLASDSEKYVKEEILSKKNSLDTYKSQLKEILKKASQERENNKSNEQLFKKKIVDLD